MTGELYFLVDSEGKRSLARVRERVCVRERERERERKRERNEKTTPQTERHVQLRCDSVCARIKDNLNRVLPDFCG